jgi:endonuclease-3 related protein
VIRFAGVFESLLATYGPQYWWPAEDGFEIMAGALLVQRTTWQSAEAALSQLRLEGLLSPTALAAADIKTIEPLVRSAGFFRSKAARLVRLANFLIKAGGFEALNTASTPDLRAALLQQEGVGPETADVILLYAFQRPVVVIDEYLRRLVQRWTASRQPVSDRVLQEWVVEEISDVARLNEFHALVVRHGKDRCSKVPRCAACELRSFCRTGRAASDA